MLYTQNSRITKDFIQKNYKVRNQIHERIIKLKSQSKRIVRFFTLTGIILGFLFAFISHPIGGTNAQSGSTQVKLLDGETDVWSGTVEVGNTLPEEALEAISEYINSNTGESFFGWYVNGTTKVFDVTSNITSDVTLVASWNISICDQNDTNRCVTIMDRNLGAKSNDITNKSSYGNHFQRGNGYGFAPCSTNSCETFPNNETPTTDTKVNTINGGYGPGKFYSYNVFRKITKSPFDWCNPMNENLWGGSGDDVENNRGYDTGTMTAINVTGRQGPCPDGYHVPSRGEWIELMDIWLGTDSNGYTGYDAAFLNRFKIPLAGYRSNNAVVTKMGAWAYLWSSSPVANGSRTYILSVEGGDSISANETSSRALATSLRCFKDSYLSVSSVHIFDEETEVWSGMVEIGDTLPEEAIEAISGYINSNTGESFFGWYVSGTNKIFDITSNIIGDTTLVASWNISICGQYETDKCIIIMDRNLGAKSNDITNNSSYGNHYQRGNSHGFAPCSTNLCEIFPNNESLKTNDRVNTIIGGYGPGKFFSSDIFMKITSSPYDWSSPSNDNLWGGSGDDAENNRGYDTGTMTAINVTGRQGPCPDGYHVPSRGEWTALMDLYSDSSTNGNLAYSDGFKNTFNLSLAGRRNNRNQVASVGDSAYIWSSSPIENSENAWYFNLDPGNGIHSDSSFARSLAISIRCFKDELCPEGEHRENGECTGNTKIVTCAQSGSKPANSSYNIVDVTGVWNSLTNSWDIPVCNRTCDTDYHTENGTTCVENTKTVACAQSGSKPANSSYNIVDVTGVWNNGTNNWDIPACSWICDTGYHTESGESCIENTKTVTCDSSGVPTHASYTIGNIQITWSGTRNDGEWTDTENCAYSCDAGYELAQNGDCKKSNVQVTFIANPSTFSDGIFSGEVTSKTLEYFFATGGYYAAKTEEIQIPQKPHEYDSNGNLLTGWMFEGWYLDTGYSASSRWTGLSVDTTYTGITLYARYLPFKDKRVTFDGVTFTIMDRNLGALDYSSGYSYRNEQSNNDRIGLYYQWGNNFGFPNDGTLQNTLSGVLIENHTNKERGQGNYYFNGSFVLGPKVFTTGTFIDNNLRNGGSTDEIGQGPCPVGYHIPQLNEFNTTINLFKKYQLTEEGITYCVGLDTSNTGIQYCMPAVLGLPFSSNRSYTTTQAQSYGAFIWTNTKVGNLVRTVIFVPSVSYITDTNNVGNGFTLRCFKDTTGVTLSYDSKGGTAVPSSTARRWFAKSTAPANPSRTGSTFAGWYRDTGYTQEFIFSGDTYISEDTTLYAKWTCKTGYEMDENGNCKKSNVQVTFVANPSTFPDGEFSGSVTSKTLEYFFATGGYYAAKTEEIQIPQNPHEVDLSGNLLTGWMFEGWYLDTGYSAASRWTGLSANTTYTGITLYARYLPFKDKTVTMDGVTFTIMDRNLGALDYSSGYSYDNEQSNETGPDGTRIRIGNYYQRGNNFGFPNKSNYNNKLTNSVSNYSNIVRGPGNYYFNGIFITNNPIYNEYNKNMWGGSGETQNNANSDIDKQGPCPIGYHIPSTYERISTVNLYNKRKNTTEGISYCSSMPSGDQFCMPAALGLPFDGYLGSNRAGLAALTTARFRSTNVNGRNIAYDLGFRSNILLPQYSDSMGYGLTIRCLKNTPDLVLNFDSKGGNNIQSKTGFKRWNPLTIASSKPNNPTRTNSTFAGWFRDTGYTNEFIFSGDTYISEDTTLYAKWTCNTGYIESLDGQSCEENILPYTINHYQENTGNNGYTLFESENKTGLSDNLTQATSKTYQGFTVQAFQQQTIQGNDTHVNIYYDRNVYTININLNGGTGPTSFTGKYGDTVVPPEITKSGYSIKKRVPALPETMPLNGFSSKPVRVLTDGSISISVNPNKNTLDLSIRGTSNSSRELTGAFTNDYFTISDTKGEENGYHATLSIGNLVGNNNENHIIPASNVQVKTDGIVRLSGTPSSEVGLTTTMTNWRTATGQVTYFTRGDIVIDDECKPGEYGIDLDLKITVPSHTIPDEYHGTITYTLYED